MQFALLAGSNVREHAEYKPLLNKLLSLFPLLILSACAGGEGGSQPDPASPSAPSDGPVAAPAAADEGAPGAQTPVTDRPTWLPNAGGGGTGSKSTGSESVPPASDDDSAEASEGKADGARGRLESSSECDAACDTDSVCDPMSGSCLPHCAGSPCVSGWSCDGRSGLCVPDRPDCGRCREGQVCDPEVRVCVAHCAWAGCPDGQCDQETGFCVE